jgi:hypothetical protein
MSYGVGSREKGSGIRVKGLVLGFGSTFQGFGFRVSRFGFRAEDVGLRIKGLKCRVEVYGSGFDQLEAALGLLDRCEVPHLPRFTSTSPQIIFSHRLDLYHRLPDSGEQQCKSRT